MRKRILSEAVFFLIVFTPLALALVYGGEWETVALCVWWPLGVFSSLGFVGCFFEGPAAVRKRFAFASWPDTVWDIVSGVAVLLSLVWLGHPFLAGLQFFPHVVSVGGAMVDYSGVRKLGE